MAAQFNLLNSRFQTVGQTFAYGSTWVQGGKTYIILEVRHGYASYAECRRVKGYDPVEFN